MKVFLITLLFNVLLIGLLPPAAFSQDSGQRALHVPRECRICWVRNGGATGACTSQCSTMYSPTVNPGEFENNQANRNDFEALMDKYVTKARTCSDSLTEMGRRCENNVATLQSHLYNAGRAHRECKRESTDLNAYLSHPCVAGYDQCKSTACSMNPGDVFHPIGGGLTLYVKKLEDHFSPDQCQEKWRDLGLLSIFENYATKRDQALSQPQCQNRPPTPPEDEPSTPSTEGRSSTTTDESRRDNKDKDNSNPVSQSMNTLSQLSQMAQPFLMQPSSQAQGTDYSVVKPIDARNPQPYRSAFDSPDYFNIQGAAEPSYDEPFLDDGGGGSTARDFNFNNNQGGGGSNMGSGGGQILANPSGGNNAGAAPPASSGRVARRPKKKDKTLYTSREEDGGGSGVFSGESEPGAVTQPVARKVGFDQNGQLIDSTFDPSKYAPRINDVYNRAINSPAMERARRRAAGFETMGSQNSRGYTDWHTTHHIHPGQLSIFKQVRICYIMKYSAGTGNCGSN